MLLGKLLSISALAATAGTAITAAPALGQTRSFTVTAPREVVPTRRVSYVDLNLASQSDAKILNRRVGFAVHDVCNEAVGPVPLLYDQQMCRSLAWKGARPQIERAVQRASEIAATGTSSIAAAAISISLER